jgi:hypothetical protein
MVLEAQTASDIQNLINKHAVGAVKLFSLTVVSFDTGQAKYVAVLKNAAMGG